MNWSYDKEEDMWVGDNDKALVYSDRVGVWYCEVSGHIAYLFSLDDAKNEAERLCKNLGVTHA